MFKEITDPTSGKKEPGVVMKVHGLTVLRVWSFYSECPTLNFHHVFFGGKGVATITSVTPWFRPHRFAARSRGFLGGCI